MRVSPAAFVRTTLPLNLSGLAELDTGRYHSIWLPDHIDLFHCWAEADLAGLLRLALPRTQLIQLSDYVLGDRALPARAVPGDGAIPIESFVAQALAEGYRFGFDLELLGPRIDAEGRFAAAGRACATVSAMLDRLGPLRG